MDTPVKSRQSPTDNAPASTPSSPAVADSFLNIAAQFLHGAIQDEHLSDIEERVHDALEQLPDESLEPSAAEALSRYLSVAQASDAALMSEEADLILELAGLLKQHPRADTPGLPMLLDLMNRLLRQVTPRRALSNPEQQVMRLLLSIVGSRQLDPAAIDRLLRLSAQLAMQDAHLTEGVYSGLINADVVTLKAAAAAAGYMEPDTSATHAGNGAPSAADRYLQAARADGEVSAQEQALYDALRTLPESAFQSPAGQALMRCVWACQRSDGGIAPQELTFLSRLIETLSANPKGNTPGLTELVSLFADILTRITADRSPSQSELSIFSQALTLVRSAQHNPQALSNILARIKRLALENAHLFSGAYSGLSDDDVGRFNASLPAAGSSVSEAVEGASSAERAAGSTSDPVLAAALQSAATALRKGADVLTQLGAWNLPAEGAQAALEAIASARAGLAPFLAQQQANAAKADSQLETLDAQIRVAMATAEPDLRLLLAEKFTGVVDPQLIATLPLPQLLQLLKLDGPVLRGLIGCGMTLTDAIRLAPSVSTEDMQRSKFTSKLRDRLQRGDSADDALLWARYQGLASDAELSDAQFREDLSEARQQSPQAPLAQHVHEARCVTLYRRLDGAVSMDTLRAVDPALIIKLLDQPAALLKALVSAGMSLADAANLASLLSPEEVQSAEFIQILRDKLAAGLSASHALIWARFSQLASPDELNDPQFIQDLIDAPSRGYGESKGRSLFYARACLLARRLAPQVSLDDVLKLDATSVDKLLSLPPESIKGFLSIGVPLDQFARLTDTQRSALLSANPQLVMALLSAGMKAADVATYADSALNLSEATPDFLERLRQGLGQGLNGGAAIASARYGHLVSSAELSSDDFVQRLLFPGVYGIPESSAGMALSLIYSLGYARNHVDIFEAAEKIIARSSNPHNGWFANAGVFQLSSLNANSSEWGEIESIIDRGLSHADRNAAIAAAQGLSQNWDYLCANAGVLNLRLREGSGYVLDFTRDNLREVNYSPLIAQLGNTPTALGASSMNAISALEFLRHHISLFEAAEYVAGGSSNPRNGWFANAGVFQLAYMRVDSGEWDQIQNTLGYALSHSDRATAIAAARGVTDHWSTLCSWSGLIGLSLRRGTSDVLDFKDNNLGQLNFSPLVLLMRDPGALASTGSRGPHRVPLAKPLAIDLLNTLQYARAQAIANRFSEPWGASAPGADLQTVLNLNLSSEDAGRLLQLDPATVRALLAQGAPLEQIAKLSPPELTTVSSVNPSLMSWLVHILGATLNELSRLSTASLQRLSAEIVPNYRPAHRDEVITDIRPESVTHPWQLAGASLAFETHSGQRIIVSRNTNPSLYNRALNLLLQRSQNHIDSLRAQLGLPPEPNVNVAELTTNVLVKHDDPSAGYYTVGQLAIKNLLDDYRGGFVIRHGIASTQDSVVTYRLNDGTALVVDKNRLKTDRAKLTFEHLLAGRTVSEAELQHLESDDGSEDLFGGDDWDTWMRVTTRLAHSDPRSQLARALEARNALANGYQLLPYYEQPGSFGSTRRIYPGGENNPTLQTATSADLRAILNEGAINNRINGLMANPTIQADYQAALSSAINSLPNKQAVADALYNALTGSTYLDILRGLNNQQLGFEAEQMTQRDLSALSLLDPARSLDAAQKLRINSLSSEFQDLANDPSKINEETFSLAITDAIGITLQVIRSSSGLIRHTAQTAMDTVKFLEETLGDKKSVDALSKVLRQLVLEAKTSGHVNIGSLSQAQFDEAMAKTYVPLELRGKLTGFFTNAQKFGVWGSIAGAGALASFGYRLSKGAWSSESSAIERWGAARDVISFLSVISHVGKSTTSTIDILRTRMLGEETNSQLAWKALGLDRTLPQVWGQSSFLPQGQSWTDFIRGPNDTPSTPAPPALEGVPPDSPRNSASSLQALSESMDSVWSQYDLADTTRDNWFSSLPDEQRPLFANASGELGAMWAAKTELKPLGNLAQRIGVSAFKILGTVTDLAGIADIVLGALGLKKAIEDGDKGMIAANALAIGGGAALTSAGIIGTASLVASVAPAVAAAAAPLFLVGAVLALAGFAVTMIVASVKRHNQLQDSSNDQTDWFRNLAREGLTHHDWFDRLEYLRYAYAIYGNDNTDPNMSYFEFQQAEWDYFRNTPQKSGSSLNRLNDDLHVYTDLTWEPPNSGDDSPHWGS